MKHFSPETRAKLSEAAKARWARIYEAGGRTLADEGKVLSDRGNTPTVKFTHVPDDEVTALVEVLRKLMPAEELASRLAEAAHKLIDQAARAKETDE